MRINNTIATFHKVSIDRYMIDTELQHELSDYLKIHEEIQLPHRGTEGSAGHDFYAPEDYILNPGDEVTIYTGVRVEFYSPHWALMLYPRSGMSHATGVRLANTTAIIDADYFYSDNEGHIIVRLCMPEYIGKKKNEPLHIKKGDRFCQGVFLPYGITTNDNDFPKKTRNGGFGSTGI